MAIAAEYATAAAVDLRVIGQADHSGVLDVDGTGTISIAFTSNFGSLDSSIIGAFVFGDYLAAGTTNATGNHADILWARAPDADNPEAELIGTLAHEYQHLVSFALRSKLGDPQAVREVLWLDEGLSHTMEDLTGWGGSTVDAFAEALQGWDNTAFAGPNDSVAQRGRAYMMIRYLIDAKARTSGAANAKSDQVLDAANALISPLYGQSRRGFQHGLFQDARSSGQLLDAVRAVYTSNNPDATAADGSKAFLTTATSPNANGQLIGFNPFGQYVSAKGQDGTARWTQNRRGRQRRQQRHQRFDPRFGRALLHRQWRQRHREPNDDRRQQCRHQPRRHQGEVMLAFALAVALATAPEPASVVGKVVVVGPAQSRGVQVVDDNDKVTTVIGALTDEIAQCQSLRLEILGARQGQWHRCKSLSHHRRRRRC